MIANVSDIAQSGSFLSNNTDDDDISMFVQDIDARKPLGGRLRSRDREVTETGQPLGPSGGEETTSVAGALLSTDVHSHASASSSTSGPMLTNESDVDEKLRQMNQTFMESLEGLGGARRRERTTSRKSSDQGSPRPSEGGIGREREGGGNGNVGRGRAPFMMPPRRPLLESRGSASPDVSGVQGSDEVIGRMSLEEERRSRGH